MITYLMTNNNNYLHFLSSLGLHIGHHVSLGSIDVYMYQYLAGSRNSFFIFNIPTSIFLLKRALLFIEKLASINPYNTICFSHSQVKDSDIIVSLLSNVQKNTQQPIIVSKWINGIFTNWNQIVFNMVKPLFARRKERFEYGFQIILAKMIFILMKRALRMDELEFYKNYNLMSRFWKFLLLFQFFLHLKKLPSSFFYVNNQSSNYPILECNVTNMPVISILDSISTTKGISYPIPGNSESILIVALTLNLITNSYLRGKYTFYMTHSLLDI